MQAFFIKIFYLIVKIRFWCIIFTMAKISIRGLSKKYPYCEYFAIYDLYLSVEDNALLVIYGKDRAGKTTLCKLIAGLIEQDGGDIFFDGEAAKKNIKERGTAYLSGDFLLFKNRSAFYNIAYPLRVRRLKKDKIKQAVSDIAAAAGIEKILDKKTKTLDAAAKLDIAFCRILTLKRAVILLDGISKNFADKKLLAQKIQGLKERTAATLIVATDDAALVRELDALTAVMACGAIEMVGYADSLDIDELNADGGIKDGLDIDGGAEGGASGLNGVNTP
jgi:ABC-type sugar transport system ATPase subunit